MEKHFVFAVKNQYKLYVIFLGMFYNTNSKLTRTTITTLGKQTVSDTVKLTLSPPNFKIVVWDYFHIQYYTNFFKAYNRIYQTYL